MEHTFESPFGGWPLPGWETLAHDRARTGWDVPLDGRGPDGWVSGSGVPVSGVSVSGGSDSWVSDVWESSGFAATPVGLGRFDEEALSAFLARIVQDNADDADRGPETARGFVAGYEAGLEAVLRGGRAALLDDGLGPDDCVRADAQARIGANGSSMTMTEAGVSGGGGGAGGAGGTGDAVVAGIWRTVALRERMGAFQAQELREFAALSALVRSGRFPEYGKDTSIAYRSLVADLALAHRVSDRTMARRVGDAEHLVTNYPASVAALAAGRVELGHLTVIADHGLPIQDSAARAAYEQVVLEQAVEVTPGRLRRYAQLEAARHGEVSFQDRCAQAHAQRRVWVVEVGDGMSELGVLLPTLLAEGIWDRLTQQAKAITAAARTAANTAAQTARVNPPGGRGAAGSNATEPGAFDARTFDQLRTDLVTELLLTGQPTGCEDAPHAPGIGIRAEVAVVIPILALLGQGQGHDTSTRTGTGTGSSFVTGTSTGASSGNGIGTGIEPATIAGKGPIDAATARRLAADAPHLVRLLTHPVTGIALTADIYTPSAKLRRFLRLRDGRCRHPGCNRAAGRCDLDHTIAWEIGGLSTPENLAHLCRGHHTLKHDGGWGVKQVSAGVLEWTSPTGRVVTDRPDAWPTFTETEAEAEAETGQSVPF